MIEALSGLALSHQVSSIESLAQSYGSWNGIRTNHVISSSGSFFDEAGSSRGLSTPEDLALMLRIRKQSDLLIVDAATARNEQYKKPSGTHLALVSATGDFRSIPAVNGSDGVTLFSPITPKIDGDLLREHVIISKQEPFQGILNWAFSMQMLALLLEAGPTLTRLSFDAKKIAQSAITITPRVPVESLTSSWNPFTPSCELVSAACSDNATFTLWCY